MAVGAIGAVGGVSGSGAVYALSPYLNGVKRTANAAAAVANAPNVARATRVSASASRNTEAIAAPASGVPYANPAIVQIADQAAFGLLSGDGGALVQAYGAVALIAAPLALASRSIQPVTPAVAPVAPVTAPALVPDASAKPAA